ncbi:MAG: hypothetical protein P1V97_06410, partial [Planctomycetota bacterium]|nr:hypothetical protein [Planctomycetota bacterium]
MFLRRWILILLLLLSFSPSPVSAQETEAELERLRFDLRKEGMLRLIEMAAIEIGDAEKARLLRSKKNRITDEFVRENLTTREAKKLLNKIYAEEISSGRLKVNELKIDRWYEGNFRSAFRVSPIVGDRMPVENGYQPPSRNGYLPEVAAINVNTPHSMTDLRDYLGNRFTLSTLDRVVKNGNPVEFHIGEAAETLTSFRNRGYEIIGEVKSIQGPYERLFMAKSPTGEVTYAVTGINGVDRVRHLSSLMRFAGPNGGVSSDKVKIFGDIDAMKERNYNNFKTALTHLGDPGGMAWIGFRGGVNTELNRRALAMEGMGHLNDVLGSNPYNKLIERLTVEAERAAPGPDKRAVEKVLEEVRSSEVIRKGFSKAPAEVFAKAENLERYLAAEKALGKLAVEGSGVKTLKELMVEGKMKVRGGGDPRALTASRTLEHRLFRGEELRVRTRGGETKSLKLINNYYGDVMGDMGRALVNAGYKKVAYFGTAGGIAEGTRIGDVHVPGAVYDHTGRLVSDGVKNSMIEHMRRNGMGSLEGRIKTNTHLANVFSPTVETMSWLDNARRGGINSVEVENSYLAEEISKYNKRVARGQPVEFMTSVMVSDLPGSEHTLGNNNGSTNGLFERMVDHYIDALGIEGVELLEKEAIEKANNRARGPHDRLAMKLLGENAELLLRENVRAMLKNGLSAEAAERALREGLTLEKLGLKASDAKSIEREIKASYGDKDVVKSVEKVNSVLSRAVAELVKTHPRANFELRLGGGFGNGHFSPVEGAKLELRGSPELKTAFERLVTKYSSMTPGAPPVKLGTVAEGSVNLGKNGHLLLHEYGALERLHASRLLTKSGINLHTSAGGGRVTASIKTASEMVRRGAVSSRSGAVTANAETAFEERLRRRGASLEKVAANDARLNGKKSVTLVEADGRVRVLLAKGATVTPGMALENLTRVNQLTNMRDALGVSGLNKLLEKVKAGYPDAKARYRSWEIKAREGVLLSLEPSSPERAAMEKTLERLRLEADPYSRFRNRAGNINFDKVKNLARTHGAGVASFTLGIFLKELARVVETGDKAIIEEFFKGLASTDFWLNYGLFSIGAEAGTIAYTRFLERFVKPSFVGGLLKSNVALASGMALSEIMMGHFDGKTYAINVSSLMLSSTAVKAGVAGLKWVVSLDSLKGSHKIAKALRLGSVPGWIYAGVETAVVLYLGDKISAGVTTMFERHKARKDVESAIADVLRIAKTAGPDDKRLAEALENVTSSFSAWRNMELSGAIAASDRLRADLTNLGHDAMKKELGFSHTERLIGTDPGR